MKNAAESWKLQIIVRYCSRNITATQPTLSKTYLSLTFENIPGKELRESQSLFLSSCP